MNVLALNTAFSEAQIALNIDGQKYYKSLDSNSKHSENLLVAVEQLFEEVSPSHSDEVLDKLEAISVVVGPGSFTGLRISVSTAKAILVTHPNIKAIAITSLELMAHEYKKPCTAVIDALSGLYFVAEFDNKSDCILQPKMIEESELKQYSNIISLDELCCPSDTISLNPQTLLSVTEIKIQNRQFVDENDLVPLYLRPSQAEANKNNANKN